MLPDGVSLGRLHGPLGALASISPRFTGAVRIIGPGGAGFVLVQRGNPCAAAFEGARRDLVLSGDEAYRYLLDQPSLDYELIAYTSTPPGRPRQPAGSAARLVAW